MTTSINFGGPGVFAQTRYVQLNRQSSPTRLAPTSVSTSRPASVSTVADSMRGLASAVAGLGTPGAFLGTTATSSDRDTVSVSSGSGAAVGEHTLEVTELATRQVTKATTGYTNTTDAVADGGSISFSVNGSTTTTISISSSTTLSELKDQINNQNSGVVASITNDGINNRLVVSSRESGKGQGFTVNNSLTITSGTVIQFETGQSSLSGNTQNAGNAHFKLNGTEFNRTANTFNDAIEGVTLTLVGEGTTSVTVSSDHNGVSKEADRFVREFNKLDAVARSIGGAESSSSDNVALGPALRHVRTATHDAIEVSYEGSFKSLTEVGFSYRKSGELKLDKDKLNAVLGSDADGVRQLFVGGAEGNGVFAGLGKKLGAHTSANGTIRPGDPISDYVHPGTASVSGLAPPSRDLAYIQNVLQGVLKGSADAPARVNIRA